MAGLIKRAKEEEHSFITFFFFGSEKHIMNVCISNLNEAKKKKNSQKSPIFQVKVANLFLRSA